LETRVPSWRLKEEAEKRRAAEKRAEDAALKAGRDEWIFRRKSHQCIRLEKLAVQFHYYL
jgi:hypothetical protein